MAKITTAQKVKILDRIYDEQMNRQLRNIMKNKYRGKSSEELQSVAKKHAQETRAVHIKRDKVVNEKRRSNSTDDNTRERLVNLGLHRKSSKYN